MSKLSLTIFKTYSLVTLILITDTNYILIHEHISKLFNLIQLFSQLYLIICQLLRKPKLLNDCLITNKSNSVATRDMSRIRSSFVLIRFKWYPSNTFCLFYQCRLYNSIKFLLNANATIQSKLREMVGSLDLWSHFYSFQFEETLKKE